MSKDRIEFFGKQQTETTLLAAKSSEGVIDSSLRIEDAGGSSQTITAPPGLVPRLEIKLKLLKPSFLRRVFHFLTHIVAPAAPFVLAYGIAEWYQEVEKYRLAGASVSSPMLFVFPAISSLMLLAIPIIIAYSVSRKST
jgi:cytochrome c biogenesis protein CcdA